MLTATIHGNFSLGAGDRIHALAAAVGSVPLFRVQHPESPVVAGSVVGGGRSALWPPWSPGAMYQSPTPCPRHEQMGADSEVTPVNAGFPLARCVQPSIPVFSSRCCLDSRGESVRACTGAAASPMVPTRLFEPDRCATDRRCRCQRREWPAIRGRHICCAEVQTCAACCPQAHPTRTVSIRAPYPTARPWRTASRTMRVGLGEPNYWSRPITMHRPSRFCNMASCHGGESLAGQGLAITTRCTFVMHLAETRTGGARASGWRW